MLIITRKRLLEFGEKHPHAISALNHWYRAAKHSDLASFSELRETFSGVDSSGKISGF